MEKLERQLKDILDMLGLMRHHMATFDDVEELRVDIGAQFEAVCVGVNTLSAQLREIDSKIEGVNRRLDNMPERIKVIESNTSASTRPSRRRQHLPPRIGQWFIALPQ